MAYIFESTTASAVKVVNPPLKKQPNLPYEIPERYRNAFYLANAALFDSTNWFLHRSLEVIFPELKLKLKGLDSHRPLDNNELSEKVENIIQVLDQCNSVIDIRFPIRRDNGRYELIRGFRAQHGLTAGYSVCLGGLRIKENVTRDQMKGLSVLSTYRNACMGIGMAGGVGGIKINPNEYSHKELQQIVQNYTLSLNQRGYCNERDVMLPDIGSGQQEMDWISEAYMKHTGRSLSVAAVGKRPELGGISNFSNTSAQGTFLAINYTLNNEDIMQKLELLSGIENKTFIIQGIGKLGKPLAELLISNGAICVGVKDLDAYIYDPKGIDFKKLCEHKEKTGSILNYDITKPLTDDKIFMEECDILILAAFQKSLICYTADKVKAKVIVEAADGSVTPSAHKILTGKAKLVLPDLYACSGATVASSLEYLQNCYQMDIQCEKLLKVSNKVYEHALEDMVRKKERDTAGKSVLMEPEHTANEEQIISDTLKIIISDVGKEMFSLSNIYNLGTDLRTAAYMIAINNIFATIYSEGKLLGKIE